MSAAKNEGPQKKSRSYRSFIFLFHFLEWAPSLLPLLFPSRKMPIVRYCAEQNRALHPAASERPPPSLSQPPTAPEEAPEIFFPSSVLRGGLRGKTEEEGILPPFSRELGGGSLIHRLALLGHGRLRTEDIGIGRTVVHHEHNGPRSNLDTGEVKKMVSRQSFYLMRRM